MTNQEIIELAKEEVGLEEDLEVNTFGGWIALGYEVKKGSKAVFNARIWKPIILREKAENATEDRFHKNDMTHKMNLVLVQASFFTKNQVKKMPKGKTKGRS